MFKYVQVCIYIPTGNNDMQAIHPPPPPTHTHTLWKEDKRYLWGPLAHRPETGRSDVSGINRRSLTRRNLGSETLRAVDVF